MLTLQYRHVNTPVATC